MKDDLLPTVLICTLLTGRLQTANYDREEHNTKKLFYHLYNLPQKERQYFIVLDIMLHHL